MCPPEKEVGPGQIFNISYGTPMYDAASAIVNGKGEVRAETSQPVMAMHEMGSITALIPEASDAGTNEEYLKDGGSGDVAFPHGNIKVLATVGEHYEGEPVVGVPDGMGAYLYDEETVRLVVQSESYGFVSGFESLPWFTNMDMMVNNGTASYTGSHVQYADYDRTMLSNFMLSEESAAGMIKGFGNLIEMSYNLKGEMVMARNRTGATTVGAHFSNTDKDGKYVLSQDAKHADWLMQSLCSAHLEEPEQWGEGHGLVDRIYVTNEEWMTFADDATAAVGLSAHAIDVATKTAHALGVFHQGGFEKIVEIMPGSSSHVAFAISGYNGDFSGGLAGPTIDRRNAMYTRADGMPYVWTRNLHPARVYVGVKGLDEMGNPATDFLSRNGLRYGKVYGFACNTTETGYRDAWHQAHYTGDMVQGKFVALNWTWTGEVVNFEHDPAWMWQDAVGVDGMEWWTAAGPNSGGAKTEHLSPFVDGTSSYVQGSTAGYFGKYTLELATALAGMTGMDLPDMVDSSYLLYQGETDVVDLIDLGGKGQLACGFNATYMYDSVTVTETDMGVYCTVNSVRTTFEDVDGLEVISAAEGHFVILQEDGGNDFGERTFIAQLVDAPPMDYKFIAMSGGPANTRMRAGVGIPAGSNLYTASHEFSGIVDLSGMLYKVGNDFYLGESYKGYEKRAAEALVPINSKYILLGLQAHNMVGGIVYLQSADRGGQWLLYQPSI